MSGKAGERGDGSQEGRVLAALFCLGFATLLAQMLVTRELITLCLGNELAIGLVFSAWLVLIGAGAGLVRRPATGTRLAMLFVWLAVVLPAILLVLRAGAGWIRPGSEVAPPGRILLAACLALLPFCLPAGMIFPRGCELLQHRRGPGVVSRVYAVEALGSVLAGALFSYVLAGRWSVGQMALMASAACLVGGGALARSAGGRYLCALAAILALVPGLGMPGVAGLDARTAAWRWRSLGVLQDGRDGRPPVRLRGSLDTRYQNLALVESGGLYTLYGDGQVTASFPDAIKCERSVHFVMAQRPGARRILLLGGNPAGELPWLLRYPVAEVVHVDRDPDVHRLVGQTSPLAAAALDRDPRLERVADDGPRYVKRCGRTFDIVLVHAPEPLTGGLNRFYTREFYEDVSRILAPGGFLHTSVEGSELLEPEAARMAGSVYKTLAAVFPVVKVTAGPPLHFFASGTGGCLSLDRETLYRRSLSAPVSYAAFKPVYFLDADELDPGKIRFAEDRLRGSGASVNTLMNPVSCAYTLVLWSRYSHSLVGSLFRRAEQTSPGWLPVLALVPGILAVLPVLAWRRRCPLRAARLVAGQAVAVIGFAGVALELLLLYAFQGLHGYVYSRMGFMVGLFMLGTVAGAWLGRGVESRRATLARGGVALSLALLAAVAFGLRAGLASGAMPEWLLYALMTGIGMLVGLPFVAVARLLVLSGLAETRAAGRAWLADYWGSALGGVLAGVVCPVVFGVGATCLGLAVLAGSSLALVLLPDPAQPQTPGMAV